MSPLKGQKIKDNPKDTRIQIRLDKETIEKLDCLATEQNSDRSKVIRKGIDIQYEQRKKIRSCSDWQSNNFLLRKKKQ